MLSIALVFTANLVYKTMVIRANIQQIQITLTSMDVILEARRCDAEELLNIAETLHGLETDE